MTQASLDKIAAELEGRLRHLAKPALLPSIERALNEAADTISALLSERAKVREELGALRRATQAHVPKIGELSLDQAVEVFADATDYNVTCFEAWGEGHVPAGAQKLYELGKQARALMSEAHPHSPPSPASLEEGEK